MSRFVYSSRSVFEESLLSSGAPDTEPGADHLSHRGYGRGGCHSRPLARLRSGTDFNDFISPYVQTRVWLVGKNPYELGVLAQSWPIARDSLRDSLIERGIPSPYPITGFPLLAPLAALSWKTATLTWAVLEVLFFALFVFSLSAITKTSGSGVHQGFMVAGALAFAPFHTGLALENITVAALACAIAALTCQDQQRNILAALLLASAIALKPTVAIPFFVYWLVEKRWRAVLITMAGCVALLSAAEIRMLWAGADWFPSFMANGKHLFAPGTVYDFSSANPLRFDLVNAQVVLSQFLGPQLSQYVAFGITVAALLLWLHFRKTAVRASRLLDLAILSAAILLPLYHRFYDAALLIFAVVWAFTELRKPASRYAWIILSAATPFLVPGAAILRSLAGSSPAVESLSRSFWWNFLVAPHQAWMVLLILTTLLGAQRALCLQGVQAASISSPAEAA